MKFEKSTQYVLDVLTEEYKKGKYDPEVNDDTYAVVCGIMVNSDNDIVNDTVLKCIDNFNWDEIDKKVREYKETVWCYL